jgi:hypothetical protein
MTCEVPPSFIHSPPQGYFYAAEEFKKNVVSIWLCNTYKFVYNGGAPTRTIHSFYNTKKQQYYAPVNSKTIGACVNIEDTRSWTSMKINYQGIEQFFV